MNTATAEIASGERFEFGKNWSRFLKVLNEERIFEAESSLKEMLGVTSLNSRHFLDVGSGSGLFSLAARRLGATVHSFDYDPHSVACTTELKRRYFRDDPHWTIEQGSILDNDFTSKLGQWDIVYSWGVLHHTGAMWKALENTASLVEQNGSLFIAIYNDEGGRSARWARIKQFYNENKWARPLLLGFGFIRFWGRTCFRELVHFKPMSSWKAYIKSRGMSPWHDLIDWMGGWPYEVATPDVIFSFLRDKGYTLQKLVTRQGIGNNEFVFTKCPSPNRP